MPGKTRTIELLTRRHLGMVNRGCRGALHSLRIILQGYGSVAVAFSGGVDSTLLLQAALMTLGKDRVLALYVRSELVKEAECSQAIAWLHTLTQRCRLTCQIIDWQPLAVSAIHDNSSLRCYHCKHHMFKLIQPLQHQYGMAQLVDGANADDLLEERPGLQAARELGVSHPLAEAGCTKACIRHISRKLHLPTWNKASASCLATRIPVDCQLHSWLLSRIAMLEKILEGLGYSGCRVRIHPHQPHSALLEIDPMHASFFNAREKNTVSRLFHQHGITSLDYQTARKSRLAIP